MMIGEQWKAVCCKRETVLGTEQDIVQFWCFDSVPYVAVFRDVCTVTESVYCFHYVCLSVRKYHCFSNRKDRSEI